MEEIIGNSTTRRMYSWRVKSRDDSHSRRRECKAVKQLSTIPLCVVGLIRNILFPVSQTNKIQFHLYPIFSHPFLFSIFSHSSLLWSLELSLCFCMFCVSTRQFANLAFQPYIGFGSISHSHENLFEPFPLISIWCSPFA